MRKKSFRKARESFGKEIDAIQKFLGETNALSRASRSWAYDYAIIRLYRAFEDFILTCLICAINNDTEQLSSRAGILFPKHLSDEVCEYLIVGNGYFDFKGRDGLLKTIKEFVSETHFLHTAVKSQSYSAALNQLSALRNFAAHDSRPAKSRAISATKAQRLSSAGAWLKTGRRFETILTRLDQLAQEVANNAPR